jgi:DNA-binding transcriptional LysR family regulator
LRERNVDLILGPIVKPFTEDDLAAELLFDDPSVVAAGKKHKRARARSVALADLIDEHWCLQPPNTHAGLSHVDSFRMSDLDVPRKKVISISVQVQIGLLAGQRYLTILPRSLLHFSGERFGIKALPVTLKVEPWATGIVTLKRRTMSPAAQRFTQLLREATAQFR